MQTLLAFARSQQAKGLREAAEISLKHHCPHNWYFEWLRKKIDSRVADLEAQATAREKGTHT